MYNNLKIVSMLECFRAFIVDFLSDLCIFHHSIENSFYPYYLKFVSFYRRSENACYFVAGPKIFLTETWLVVCRIVHLIVRERDEPVVAKSLFTKKKKRDANQNGKNTDDSQYRRDLWCPTLVEEENKTPFIRVWKPSPNRRVLKP